MVAAGSEGSLGMGHHGHLAQSPSGRRLVDTWLGTRHTPAALSVPLATRGDGSQCSGLCEVVKSRR